MNSRIYLTFLFIISIVVSCKKEKDTTKVLPKFEGITYFDDNGYLYGTIDSTDWRTDDKFATYERNLFDTLKFDQALHLKALNQISFDSDLSIDTFVPVKNTIVHFYPNPLINSGYLKFKDASIMNIVLVDSTFAKKIDIRVTNYQVMIDLSTLNTGIYRMYYVFQNSNYKIIGLGHGDIKKYDTE